MKRLFSIALILALTAALVTGCSSPMDDNGSTTGAGTPTTPTTLPAGTLMTEPTTQPTEPSETVTTPTTMPTDATTGTDNGSTTPSGVTGRGRPMR